MTHYAVFVQTYPKLSESFIDDELRLLLEAGLDLSLIARRSPRDPGPVSVSSPLRNRLIVLAGRKKTRRILWRRMLAAAFHHPVGFTRTWLASRREDREHPECRYRDHFERACCLVGSRRFRRLRVEHVHAHFLQSGAEIARYVAGLLGVDLSLSAHAVDIYTQDPDQLRRLMGAARGIMTCTAANAEYLGGLMGSERDRVHLVYHGVDTARFAPEQRSRPTRECLDRIVAVARLVPKKGFDTLIDAVAILAERGTKVSCEIIGDGPLLEELRRRAVDRGVEDRVRLPGAIPREEVAAALGRSGIFALPSRLTKDGNRDGIPNSLAEAMAMGMPCVATAISGIGEIVESGSSGLLVAPDDPNALADAIAGLLRDPDRAERMGAAARERVCGVFDRRKLIEDCARLLRDFSGESRR